MYPGGKPLCAGYNRRPRRWTDALESLAPLIGQPEPKTLLRNPWFYVAVALVGMLSGYLLRTQLIEPQEIGAICTAEQVPLWCQIRHGIILGLVQGPWPWGGVVLVGISLFLPRALAPALLVPGMWLGGALLFIYSAKLGALAVVTGLLRGIRLGEPAQEVPA